MDPVAGIQHSRGRTNRNELHLAAHVGSIAGVVALLLSGVVDVNQQDSSSNGWTPLMVGAFGGFFRIVESLLNEGASPSIAGDSGETALHLCAHQGCASVARALIAAGAELEAANGERRTTVRC